MRFGFSGIAHSCFVGKQSPESSMNISNLILRTFYVFIQDMRGYVRFICFPIRCCSFLVGNIIRQGFQKHVVPTLLRGRVDISCFWTVKCTTRLMKKRGPPIVMPRCDAAIEFRRTMYKYLCSKESFSCFDECAYGISAMESWIQSLEFSQSFGGRIWIISTLCVADWDKVVPSMYKSNM